MKASNAEPETTATLKKRIDELKAQHVKDMQSLYAYYAHLYHEDQVDLQLSRDDSELASSDDYITSFDVSAQCLRLAVIWHSEFS